MATFSNNDVAKIEATLAPFGSAGREFHVELGNYGRRLEVSVSLIVNGEQYRNGCLFDTDEPAAASTYREMGHDQFVSAFAGLCAVALVGYAHSVIDICTHKTESTPPRARSNPMAKTKKPAQKKGGAANREKARK